MKKMLFISYFYYPDNAIGAIRATKLLKYLTINHNYQCDVITINNNSMKTESEKSNNYYRDKYTIQLNTGKKRRSYTSNLIYSKKISKNSLIIVLKSKLRKVLNFIKQYIIYFRSLNFIKKIDIQQYDAMFSSYGPACNHLIARHIKKKYNKIIWIADFRDPVYNPLFSLRILKKYEKDFANRICRTANVITVVSNGYSKALFLKNKEKMKIIYNGYDSDDYVLSDYSKFNKFTITSLGNLYDGYRDIRPVIKTISTLIAEGKINIDDIQFLYAGNDSVDLLKQLEEYHLGFLLIDKGFIQQSESLIIQKRSHILLLPTWNNYNYEGVIPGKFYEFLKSGVPIISLVSGNKSDSEIKELTNKTNSGFVFESSNANDDYNNLIMYIYEIYIAFKQNKCFTQKINECEVKKYDYISIAKQFNDLILDLLN